jgi:hypothetical protein
MCLLVVPKGDKIGAQSAVFVYHNHPKHDFSTTSLATNGVVLEGRRSQKFG